MIPEEWNAIYKYLTLSNKSGWAYNDRIYSLFLMNDTASDSYIRIAFSYFVTFIFQIWAVLFIYNMIPVNSFILRGKTIQFCDRVQNNPSNLSLAISRYLYERSMPIDFRPRLRATTRVVPVPAKGSSTTPFAGHVACIGIRHKSIG